MVPRAQTSLVILLGSCLLSALGAGIVFATAADDFKAAKDSYDQAWHDAAESNKHRAVLESNLQLYASKVDQARTALEAASRDRFAARQKIIEHKKLIDAITNEIRATEDLRRYYASLASQQR